MRRRWLILIPVAVLVALVGFIALRHAHRGHHPLTVSYWYWHTPFKLTGKDEADLKSAGVHRLFVRAARIALVDGHVVTDNRQSWNSHSDFDIDLVFDVSPSFAHAFATSNPATLASEIAAAVDDTIDRAQAAGIKPTGVQIDFDCPTRLLPRYAAILARLKGGVHRRHLALSVTVLPTWYGSPDIVSVLSAVDFSAPQFYEEDTPASLANFATVSNIEMLRRGLAAAGRAGYPFYAGIPAYGHELVYRNGRLAGAAHGLDLEDALHDPMCRLKRAYGSNASGDKAVSTRDYIGEDIYDFAGSDPSIGGPDGNWDVVYDMPSPAIIARHLAIVREQTPDNCLGVILYRMPSGRNSATLPIATVASVIHGERPSPHLSVDVKPARLPWDVIDDAESSGARTSSRSGSMPMEVTVRVTNDGAASTFAGPGCVKVHLDLDPPGLTDASRLSFDTLQTSIDGEACSPLRANQLDAATSYMG
jgi:hypothetical protein